MPRGRVHRHAAQRVAVEVEQPVGAVVVGAGDPVPEGGQWIGGVQRRGGVPGEVHGDCLPGAG